jgi:hypothetical protein
MWNTPGVAEQFNLSVVRSWLRERRRSAEEEAGN